MKLWNFEHSKKCIKCEGHNIVKNCVVDKAADNPYEYLDCKCNLCGGKYNTKTWENSQKKEVVPSTPKAPPAKKEPVKKKATKKVTKKK
jgi:NAD dependent epimerase/dehydratase family enzyme